MKEITGEDSMLHMVCDDPRPPIIQFIEGDTPETRLINQTFVSETVALLLRSGKFDVNVNGEIGRTPLCRAVWDEEEDIVRHCFSMTG